MPVSTSCEIREAPCQGGVEEQGGGCLGGGGGGRTAGNGPGAAPLWRSGGKLAGRARGLGWVEISRVKAVGVMCAGARQPMRNAPRAAAWRLPSMGRAQNPAKCVCSSICACHERGLCLRAVGGECMCLPELQAGVFLSRQVKGGSDLGGV